MLKNLRPQSARVPLTLLLLALSSAPCSAQAPLGSAFTYQGELATEGTPATGTYDLRFRLYDAASGGNQIGSTLCSDNLAVTAGRFAASLDFGAAAFSGQQRFLEIEVRQDTGLDCSDATGFTRLSPRQELTATPNATFAMTAQSATTALTATNALNAANATTLNGQPPSFFTNASNLTGTLPSTSLSGTYSNALTLTNTTNVFAGDGSAITGLNASNISDGTLDPARMPMNWAAGGDLSGLLPNPTIAPGAVTLSKMAPSIQGVLSSLRSLAPTPPSLLAWGWNRYGQLNVPTLPAGTGYTAAAGGSFHALALRSDGAVLAWGDNTYGQTNVPNLPPGITYTGVAAGSLFNLALRSDGIVVAWGDNAFGQLNVPALPDGVTYEAVAAGENHCLALRSNGTIISWGYNAFGLTTVPTLPSGVTYTAVAAGQVHSLGLRSDGTIVAWGMNVYGGTNVPALPPGVTYTAVAGAGFHTLALRSDGSAVAWGWNAYGQTNVPALPPGVTYTALAAGFGHSLALRSNGTVVAWGSNDFGQTNVPTLPPGVTYTAVAGGDYHSLALRSDPVFVPSVWTSVGLSVGSTTPPPANGGISVAGASSFASGVTAQSFTGSGAGLTNLNASSITGLLNTAQIPSLDASKITSGTLAADRIATLDASKITSGVLAPAQIPSLDASKITSGTLAAAQIPNLDASKITTGTLSNARTTGTNLGIGGTLVQRDAAGNFAAGTITADLIGTASIAANSNLLAGQAASFYQDASNLSAGLLPDARLSNNIPRLNGNALFGANLGVGVASPLQRLHVGGSGLFGDNGIDNFAVGFDAQPNARLGFVKKSGLLPAIASAANQPIVFSQSNQGDIFTNINGATFTERMRVAANGNVGINNNLPIQTLDVNGRMRLANGIIQNGTTPVTATTDLGFYSQGSTQWIRMVTNNGSFQWYTEPGPDGVGVTPRMTLNSAGLNINGTLAKAGGSFKIDHPLDPENKYLYHSFVESPDMMNIYNGEVTTDGTGYAVVTLPDYFQALNRDFRYQLTVIDDDDQSDVVVWAKVVRRIGTDAANTFTIRTFRPNVAVSWQVTGIRKDAWAEKNRIPNSVDKVGPEKGTLLHPEAFGKPQASDAADMPPAGAPAASK